MMGGDFLGIVPGVNEVNEYINSISKFSNDYKLNNAWKCIVDGEGIEKAINEIYNYVSLINMEKYTYNI